MPTLRQDVARAARTVTTARAYSCGIIGLLSLGIGACVAVFSLAEAIYLRPLPFANPQQLWVIGQERGPSCSGVCPLLTSPTAIAALASGTTRLGRLAFLRDLGGVLRTPTETVSPIGAAVSSNIFSVLGVPPLFGRVFVDQPLAARSADEIILSYSFWSAEFGGDTTVIGKSVEFNEHPYEIVGIMPPSFMVGQPLIATNEDPAGYFIPVGSTDGDAPTDRRLYSVVSRLNRHHSIAELLPHLAPAFEDFGETSRDPRSTPPPAIASMNAVYAGAYAKHFRMFFLAVMMLLGLACANASGLFLARLEARRQDLAIRHALGADHFRLARPLLFESAFLCVIAGVVGVGLAYYLTGLSSLLPTGFLPYWTHIRVDWGVLGFAVLLTGTAGMSFIAIPLLLITASPPSITQPRREILHRGRRITIVRQALLIGQVSVTLMLLTCASLLTRTFLTIASRPTGMATNSLVRGLLDGRRAHLGDPVKQRELANGLLEALQSVPGIAAAGESGRPTERLQRVLFREGDARPLAPAVTPASLTAVSPAYFRALGVPLLAGRSFTSVDGPNQPRVAILDSATASAMFSRETAIGRRIRLGVGRAATDWMTIVGVVGTINGTVVKGPLEFHPVVYVPLDQSPTTMLSFTVRMNGSSSAALPLIRARIHEFAPALPISTLRTVEDLRAAGLDPMRVNALIAAICAIAALLVAVIGIYALTAYLVGQSLREMAIRVALGASQGDVLRLAVRPALRVVLIGSTIGIAGSLAVSQLIRAMLYQVTPQDLRSYCLATIILAVPSVVGSLIPALTATRVDPVDAMRAV